MAVYCISDLHLSEARPQLTAALLRFLQQQLHEGDQLYILGDLFDVWVGDDAADSCALTVATALRQCQQQGITTFYIHGNRDFLIREGYAARAGLTLLPEQHQVDFYGTPALLMHGDSLCTRDLAYMQFRRKARSWWWPRLVLLAPRWYRHRRAAAYRAHSQMVKQVKSLEIMDVTPDEVVRVMTESGCRWLIHGHTHRPACHRVKLATGDGWRLVLGEWHDSISYLRIDERGPQLCFAPLANG